MTVVVSGIPLPPPSRSDPVNFPARGDATMAAIPAMVDSMNAQNVENNAINALLNENVPAFIAVAENEANINAVAEALPELVTKVSKTGSAQVMEVDLTVPSLNGGQLSGQRRKNLNGAMMIGQMGTSFACPANADTSTLDGWAWYATGATVATVTQSTDVPAGSGFQFSQRVTINTADTNISAGDQALLFTAIEGYDAYDLIGQPVAASFWVRSAKTGTHGVSFQSGAVDRSYITTYTVNAANTWEKKTVLIPTGLITAGTWNWEANVGLFVVFALTAGTTFRTTAGAWQNGNYFTTSAQVNVCDAVNNVFAITGVQIEKATKEAPYEHMRYANEFMWAQRYLRWNGALIGVSTSTTRVNGVAVDFSSNPMRAAPSLLIVSTVNALHDVSVAFRNISAVTYSGTITGGYLDITCSTTTNNKVHNLVNDYVIFDSRML